MILLYDSSARAFFPLCFLGCAGSVLLQDAYVCTTRPMLTQFHKNVAMQAPGQGFQISNSPLKMRTIETHPSGSCAELLGQNYMKIRMSIGKHFPRHFIVRTQVYDNLTTITVLPNSEEEWFDIYINIWPHTHVFFRYRSLVKIYLIQ